MMYPFCKYADETEVTFSNIVKNEDGQEVLYVHFERPMEYGFDSIRFELPTYKVVYEEGHYSENEKEMFKKTKSALRRQIDVFGNRVIVKKGEGV